MKELVTIEFRYSDERGYRNKTITVGVFDTLEQAVKEGNKAIDVLNLHFNTKQKDRFTLNGLFGFPSRLVVNYSNKQGVQYFAKIERLDFEDLSDTVLSIFKAVDKRKEYEERERAIEEL